MPEILDQRVAFNAGELSPWLDPRLDLDKYRLGCRQLQNMRATIYGGAVRRPGTNYLGDALTASTACRLIPFLGGNGTDYILEFSHLKVRVWNADSSPPALIPALEVPTVFEAGELNQIQFAQQNDVMYLTHPNHFPQVLLRKSATDWICGNAKFDWPVTMGPNVSRISIRPLANAYVDDWDSGVTYQPDQHVLHSGVVYKCKATSTANTPPNATYWTVNTWSNGKAYLAGDVILYSGVYYVATDDHTAATGSEPDTEAGEVFYAKALRTNAVSYGTLSAYSALTDYVIGDVVTYGGLVYVRTDWGSGVFSGIAPTGDPNSSDAWLEINDPNTFETPQFIQTGSKIGLESSQDLFETGHVGGTFLISHRRPDTRESFVVDAVSVGYTTEPIFVLGAWTASSTTNISDNNLNVVIAIERSTNLVDWEFYANMTVVPVTNNQILTGDEQEPIYLRLRLVSASGLVDSTTTAELSADNPIHYGLIHVTERTSATQVKGVVLLPLYSYDRTTRWEEPAFTSVRGFPRAVTLHDGRLWYAGITAKPTTVWGSTVDAYWNFRLGTNDDLALQYTVSTDESSTIEWLISQDLLCIGTSSSEWVLGQRPGDDEIRLRRNTSFGAAPIQARAVGDALVYVQKSRRKLREFAFNFESDKYLSSDLNMLAEHMGDAEMLQIATQRNPESMVWVVTTRGDLLLLTYERGQNVAGWARFVTDGSFESVAVVHGDGEDDHVWVVVKRTIQGATKRYIERFEPDILRSLKEATVEDYVFVDSAKKYSGSGLTSITGLTHLAGKTVQVIGDGKPQTNKVVSAGGTISITAANKVIVGLGYTSTIEPTYFETPPGQIVSKAAKKRLTRVVADLWKSYGMEISADAGTTWQPFQIPVTPTFDALPGTLYTGPHEHYCESSTERQSTAIIRQTNPAPLAVMAMAMRYQVDAL